MNYPIVKDSHEDDHINQSDIVVNLTFAEHELICDVLTEASEMMDFSIPYGTFDLPIESPIVQRQTLIDNLRERFNVLWCDRFNQ